MLLNSLKNNHKLEFLELAGNHVEGNIIFQIEEMLRPRRSKTSLSLKTPIIRSRNSSRPESPFLDGSRSARIPEIDHIIGLEIRKSNEFKLEVSRDLAQERSLREFAENKLKQLREETTQKDLKNRKTVEEYEKKIKILSNDKNELIDEVNKAKELNQQMIQIYEFKIAEYSEQISGYKSQSHGKDIETFREIEKIKQLHRKEIESIFANNDENVLKIQDSLVLARKDQES